MKKYLKLGLAVVSFLVFLGVVSLLYNRLSAEYKPEQNLVVNSGSDGEKAGSETDRNMESEDSMEKQEDENGSGDSTKENVAEENNNQEEMVTDNVSDEEASNLAIDFVMENATGEEVALFDYIGKPVVLNFWASWCGPCKAEIPDFQEAYEKYEGKVTFLMVNMTDGAQETKESATSFIEEQGYTLPFYFDTKLQGAYTYGVYSLPTTFFINGEGEMIAYAQGMIDAETLEQGISMIYGEN
ncbi:MAG: TlpA family protein disulfide reductase [Lachnospiraceae bacterium]|nr:TlpA family protein disulfide reductase [Lachnospiraceae bacterium]